MNERYGVQVPDTSDLLRTKFARPRLRSSFIPRDSLFARLDSGLEGKLTLVCAPAGYGKTTLISTWLAQQRDKAAGAPLIAWLSLDEGDDDPVRFWRYVLVASQQFDLAIGQTALDMLQNVEYVRLESVLTDFINELSTLTAPCVFVLDDYHLVESAQVHESLAFFLGNLPETAHVVLISRAEPPLPLARLKARGEMLDLRATDLRFSIEETQCYLQQALPYELSAALIAHVQSRTDGWAVGLHLVSLALQNQTEEGQRERVVTSLTGGYHPISEYLVSEVLEKQSESTQEFLLCTSILSQLTGSLCNAVTGGTQGARILEELHKANLFLISLDENGEWYRFHSLFAEAMRREAARRFGSETMRLLYRQAGDWYDAHRMPSEAVEMLFKASAFDRAANLVEKVIEQEAFSKYRELHTLRRWLEQLPEQLIYERPNLCFALARVLLYTRAPNTLPDPIQIDNLLRIAEDAWRAQNDSIKLGESLVFRSVFALLRGEHAHLASDVKQALRNIPQAEAAWRGVGLNLLATEALLAGQLDTARQVALESLSLWEGTDVINAILATTLLLIDVYIGQGEQRQAAALCNRVMRDAEQDRLDPAKPLFKAKALSRLASIYYEWNDLVQAEQLTQQALDLNKQVGDEVLQVEAVLQLAHIFQVRGQFALAQQAVADLTAQIPASVSPLFWREILAHQAKAQLSLGNLSEVERWRAARTQHPLRQSVVQQEQEEVLVARLLIAQGDADGALDVLEPLQVAARNAGRLRSASAIQMVVGLAHISRQDLEAAKQVFAALLNRAQATGYRRFFLEDGVVIIPVLQAFLLDKPHPAFVGYVESLLADLNREGTPDLSDYHAESLFPTPLSAQEERVFSLFVNGFSKKEIADELLISVNTVKTHLQHIYQKLNINSRAEARTIARQARRPE